MTRSRGAVWLGAIVLAAGSLAFAFRHSVAVGRLVLAGKTHRSMRTAVTAGWASVAITGQFGDALRLRSAKAH